MEPFPFAYYNFHLYWINHFSLEIIIVPVIGSIVFLWIEMHHKTWSDSNLYYVALFFIFITNMFNAFAKLSKRIFRFTVLFKQHDIFIYPASNLTIPIFLLKIPMSLSEVRIWVVMNYYYIGCSPKARKYYQWYFFIMIESILINVHCKHNHLVSLFPYS